MKLFKGNPKTGELVIQNVRVAAVAAKDVADSDARRKVGEHDTGRIKPMLREELGQNPVDDVVFHESALCLLMPELS